MSTDWQNLSVLVAVAAAIGYLGRAAWRSASRRNACGGCGSCAEADSAKQLVGIDHLARSANPIVERPPTRGP